MRNYRLDRIEKRKDYIYNTERGTQPLQNYYTEVFIKCKLIHSKNKSLIVPDLIYILTDDNNFEWIQYYSFLPCLLTELSKNEIIARLDVDISFGHILSLTITNDGHIRNLPDSSNLFKCKIRGPKNLLDYTTGKGKIIDGVPYVSLFHHTLPKFKRLITEGGFFKCSSWNYQGTKELVNYSYCYFTSLPRVLKPADLNQIAMSSKGKIGLIVDGTNETIELKVYRESTGNRTATLELLIDSSIIENNHIWEHRTVIGQVYYEKSNAFIYRVGVNNGNNLEISTDLIKRQPGLKSMNYIIIGDACSKDGIIAPYDEEKTEHVFKIEFFDTDESNILTFWLAHSNQDLYARKDIEQLELKASK